MADDKTITFPVEATHIKMFARAIGDYSPEFHDADAPETEAAGGLMAPPTFPQAVAQFNPDYHLRLKPGQPWFGSGANPSSIDGKPASSGGLHAEQHFEFIRPVRPGDVLSVTIRDGETWERESKRAGKLSFSERITEYRDQNGDLVCTARSVGVRTERPVDQD
jgi:acyl dehydratase